MNRFDFTTRDRRQQQLPRVISILSGKGGVGKSVVAFNLAGCFARCSLRTLIIDAVLGSGNQHVLANVAVHYGLNEYANGTLSLVEAVTPLGDNLDLLAASGNSWIRESDNSSDEHDLKRLRADITRYDLVIIDHSTGLTNRSFQCVRRSDLCVIVLVPELTAIADAYGLFKHLNQNLRTIPYSLLINRAELDEADYVSSKFSAMAERFLGVAPTLLGSVPEDATVRSAVASQTSVFDKSPDSPASRALVKIADVLADGGDRVSSALEESFSQTIHKPTAVADRRG